METNLLLNIGLLLFFAILGGILSKRLKQPVVLGLLIVGMVIGPNLLGLVDDPSLIDIFVEFGAILFLFTIGLEFSVQKLAKIGGKALFAALFKVGIMFFFGFLTIILLGFDTVTAAFVGVIFSFSSTMIITNILKQKELIKRKEVPLLIAVLVLEDIFGIVALTFFGTANSGSVIDVVNGIQHLVISLGILVVVYIIASRFAEELVTWIRQNTNDEAILFISLLFCSGFAYLAYVLGLSPSAGAFLAGSVISNFKESKAFEHSLKPYSYMFTAFFFISMGMMINIQSVFQNIGIIILLAIAVVVGLYFAIGVISRMFAGFSKESALFSAIVMLPPGVFSLLVAKESLQYNLPIDLVSIVSVEILILSFVVSLLLSHEKKITSSFDNPIKRNKQSAFSRSVNNISHYFETLFSELKIDNDHTRKAKISIRKTLQSLMIFVITLIVSREIIRFFSNRSKFLFYFFIVISVALIGYELFRSITNTRILYNRLTKVLAALNGGTKHGRIKESTRSIILATIFLFFGIFSPMFLFLFALPKMFILVSVGLILLSFWFYRLAGETLDNIAYYEVPQTYKKFSEINFSARKRS